jgi:hypothetical protein
MANTSFLNVSELSFDGIKNNLKTYMKNQAVFADYDFEGSNLGALVDILAYNTYMNSFYLNMVGSESFLDSSVIKSSVVSHAKELNYVPRSKTSARAKVTFTINTGGAAPRFVVIPENYSVKTTVDGINMDFTTSEAIVVYPSNGQYVSDQVYVYEGKIVTETFNVTSDTRFTLQSENVDTNSIRVYVQNSSTDTTTVEYTLAENLVNVNAQSKVFFIQGYKSNQYELVFGDGVAGKAISVGNVVKVKYRSTNGTTGNKASVFSASAKINGLYTVTVTTNSIASDGALAETTDSIKFYAPRHFTTQYRAVTRDDYVNLIRARYPQIQTVNVYGGEDADPPQYGRVLISLIPNSSIPFVSDELKSDIINYLKTKSITTEPIIVDPQYLYVDVSSLVFYDPSATTKTQGALTTLAKNAIQNYNNTYLTEFGNDLRKSKLQAMIDSADSSFVSNQTQLRASYKIKPIRTINNKYYINFGNALSRTNYYGYNPGDERVINSSAFKYYRADTGIVYDAYISDDGNGKLIVYYISANNPYEILNSNIGTVDYSTGKLSFDITVQEYINSIDISAKLLYDDITVNNTIFLAIDFSKINVTLQVYNA